MSDVTQLLSAIEAGDPHAPEQLLPLVYNELRKLAAGHMANESPGHTLNATGLVHEACPRLVSSPRLDVRPRVAHQRPGRPDAQLLRFLQPRMRLVE